jgi:hypothetical protein
MARDGRRRDVGRRLVLREGYQGKPLPPGVKVRPPAGPAANVPVPKVSTKK